MSRYVKILVGSWMGFVLLPALAQASTATNSVAGTLRAAQAMDASVAAYLAFCPVGTASYVLSAIVLSPALLVLAALDSESPKRPALLWLLVMKVLFAWCLLNGLCLLLLFGAEVAKARPVASALSWNTRIWLCLLVSGLPAVAFGGLLATVVRDRTWRSVAFAVALAAVVGLLGRLGPVVGFPWVPATADQFLLGGRGDQWWPGVTIATSWFAGAMSIAVALVFAQERARPVAAAE